MTAEFMFKLYASPNRTPFLYKQMLLYILEHDRVSLVSYLLSTPLKADSPLVALKDALIMNQAYDEWIDPVVHTREIHAFFSTYLASRKRNTWYGRFS